MFPGTRTNFNYTYRKMSSLIFNFQPKIMKVFIQLMSRRVFEALQDCLGQGLAGNTVYRVILLTVPP